jgi:hypothetical protein
MKITSRVAALAAGAVVGVAALAGAAGAAPSPSSNGSKAAFFAGGTGTASWQDTSDSGQVIQLSSPDGNSYGGFQGHGIDGVKISAIKALSYDFRVVTPGWNASGGGSPRLVVDLSDGWNLDLNPVTTLSAGTGWNHMDALTGSVDEMNPTTNGYHYQTPWNVAVIEHQGATVQDAYVVNDSGWEAPLTVQIHNLTLNSTVYNHPGNSNA